MEITAMATVPFSVRLDSDIKAKLEEEAKREERSASALAVKAIKAFLQAKEAKRLAIEEAIKEADKGVFYSQEAVHALVDSWGKGDKVPIPEPDVFLKKK